VRERARERERDKESENAREKEKERAQERARERERERSREDKSERERSRDWLNRSRKSSPPGCSTGRHFAQSSTALRVKRSFRDPPRSLSRESHRSARISGSPSIAIPCECQSLPVEAKPPGGNPRSSRDDDSYRRESEEEEIQKVKGRCARGGPCECSRTRRAESRSDFDDWRRSPCGNAILRIIIGEQHPVSHSSP